MKINKANLFAMILCIVTLVFIIVTTITQAVPMALIIVPTLCMIGLIYIFTQEFILEVKHCFKYRNK